MAGVGRRLALYPAMFLVYALASLGVALCLGSILLCSRDTVAGAVAYLAGIDLLVSLFFAFDAATRGHLEGAVGHGVRVVAMSGALMMVSLAAGCLGAARVAAALFIGSTAGLVAALFAAYVYRLLSLRG